MWDEVLFGIGALLVASSITPILMVRHHIDDAPQRWADKWFWRILLVGWLLCGLALYIGRQ